MTSSTTPLLLTPTTLRSVTVPNRVWLAPMCQYSATDGMPNDWHLAHLGARVTGGFGLVLTEATAVVPEGRISPEDTGIWNDEQAAAWRRITDFAHTWSPHGSTPIGIQLAHAGRKASTWAPWRGGQDGSGRGRGSVPLDQGGWTTLGPSASAYEGFAEPREMTTDEIAAVVTAFGDGARRAHEAGFDVVEVHAAHGYLLHQFLSPLANQRTDAYGGSFENRIRLVVEVVDAVRAAWPEEKPVLVRLSATDWVEGGWTPEESTRLAAVLAEHGVDLVDVSSGGLDARQEITAGPGYQVPFATQVRSAGLPVGAVGEITDPDQAEEILATGLADVVLLARVALREPAWPLRAAAELGVGRRSAPYPAQYTRGAWPDAG
ncbi:NADH:flavin oxidoreductase/NADH oxidase [Nocardioides zeae]|uniref:2,4-dienoyl-CoA reductase-like NADH-dependent reductase (Old Yellow Enzyme family) n=1 Tax=Nocardioides zeae TaxID=1457234 RepID=A0AAJ1TZ64_9ACTN|nr:NADH:flavin oxidoreductase/NADH oxidase [Nocardioides zeae]MDQ1104965.1 2,4-dienoyl-CoA reductase-like NADH-dependent reductase (Old Yellow Enzyme family) [Nocardioides zeae]